jgi:hypothetical protein
MMSLSEHVAADIRLPPNATMPNTITTALARPLANAIFFGFELPDLRKIAIPSFLAP